MFLFVFGSPGSTSTSLLNSLPITTYEQNATDTFFTASLQRQKSSRGSEIVNDASSSKTEVQSVSQLACKKKYPQFV